MINFPRETEFEIGFDEVGNICIVGSYPVSPLFPFFKRHFILVEFHTFSDASAFGQMIVDFCAEHQTKIPEYLLKAFAQDDNEGEVGAKI